jgi:2-aminoethylphosphonate-pyruvate transaminase
MLLLIPGPVTTRPEVRAALAQDIAPWDLDFAPIYAGVRDRLLRIGGGIPGEHTCLPLQGSGHIVTEAAIRGLVPPGGKVLVAETGRYSDSMIRLAREAGREPIALPIDTLRSVEPAVVARALADDPTIGHVALVQSETGTGVIHDVQGVGAVVRAAGRRMIVDAVSAFGALPMNLADQPEIDAVVFTPNKCLEAFPGIAFAIARIDRLQANAGQAGSWSLDLHDIHVMSQRSGPGRPRFTPPAQIVHALHTALNYHDAEGGRAARLARYTENARTFHQGMIGLGLTPYLAAEHQGPIITVVHAPSDPKWNLQAFVDALKRRGIVISNFFNTPVPTFRVGCIGAITPADMRYAVQSMAEALNDLGITCREPKQP